MFRNLLHSKDVGMRMTIVDTHRRRRRSSLLGRRRDRRRSYRSTTEEPARDRESRVPNLSTMSRSSTCDATGCVRDAFKSGMAWNAWHGMAWMAWRGVARARMYFPHASTREDRSTTRKSRRSRSDELNRRSVRRRAFRRDDARARDDRLGWW